MKGCEGKETDKGCFNKIKSHRNRYITIALILIILGMANLLFAFCRITGDSMDPNYKTGDYVLIFRTGSLYRDDVIVFKHKDKTLCRRIIGITDDVVDLDENGNVFLNGQFKQDNHHIIKSYEPCDIAFPIKVVGKGFFVMGDNRQISLDSRIGDLGLVDPNKIIGKVVFRIHLF